MLKPDDWGIEPTPCHLYHPMHGTYQMLQFSTWGAAAEWLRSGSWRTHAATKAMAPGRW